MGKHTAIYARVSKMPQDAESQITDLSAWCADKAVNAIWYADDTAMRWSRPEWAKLEDKINRGWVDTLVVWRLDRLGMTCSGLAALFDKLINAGINLVSLQDGMDLNTPAGRQAARMLASMARYDTEVRSERVKAGIVIAKANGKVWGPNKKQRPRKMDGEKLELLRALWDKRTPIAKIARRLGVQRWTVYRALKKQLGIVFTPRRREPAP